MIDPYQVYTTTYYARPISATNTLYCNMMSDPFKNENLQYKMKMKRVSIH